jgi:DNA mismatch repair protein MutL
VDVNVHPTKQLVRFSEEKEVRLAISEAVRNAIQGTGETAAPDQDGVTTDSETSDSSLPTASERDIEVPLAAREHRPAENLQANETHPSIPPSNKVTNSNEGPSMLPDSLFGTSKDSRSHAPRAPDLSEQRGRIEEASAPLSRVGSAPGVERGELPRLRDVRVVGQIGSGYILVDDPLAAWIVDQHVAHERALLDRLTDPEDEQMPTIQTLLVPEVVELPPQDAAEAADSLEELSVYGFEVEPFGKASFRINGVISTLADRDVAGAFREAISAMKGTAAGMSREQRILATIACHSAVKLGDKLSYQEMEALIKEWLSSRYPATCPHGRSICYRLGHKEIARKLDRH